MCVDIYIYIYIYIISYSTPFVHRLRVQRQGWFDVMPQVSFDLRLGLSFDNTLEFKTKDSSRGPRPPPL